MNTQLTATEAGPVLAEADARRGAVAGFSPYIAGFLGACGVSALGGLAMYLSGGSGSLYALAMVAIPLEAECVRRARGGESGGTGQVRRG